MTVHVLNPIMYHGYVREMDRWTPRWITDKHATRKQYTLPQIKFVGALPSQSLQGHNYLAT